jgi:IS30 family transposase
MRLLAKGWTVAAARREVGASRSTGNRWKNGHNLYRRSEPVGFVAALDPVVGPDHLGTVLSADEHLEIANRLRAGESIRAIATALGRAPSTVSREIRRHGRGDGVYPPVRGTACHSKRSVAAHANCTHANRGLTLVLGHADSSICWESLTRTRRRRVLSRHLNRTNSPEEE